MRNEKKIRRVLLTLVAGAFLLGFGCSPPSLSPTDNEQAKPPIDGPSAAEIMVQDKKDSVINEQMEEANTEQRPVPTKPVGVLPAARIENKVVRLASSKGEIVFDLYAGDAPKAVSNFVALAESGYFDGLVFHRVVPGFVIQGGDPEGTGRGGPGYTFEDEAITRDYKAGTVAMANAGQNTNGSQFFICLEDLPTLPKAYTIFGQVTSGLDVVRAIGMGDTMDTVLIENK